MPNHSAFSSRCKPFNSVDCAFYTLPLWRRINLLENKKIMKRKNLRKVQIWREQGAHQENSDTPAPSLYVTPLHFVLFSGHVASGKPKLTRQNFKRFDGGVCVCVGVLLSPWVRVGVWLSLCWCVWLYYSLSVGVQLYLFDVLQLQQFPFPAAAALLHLLHLSIRLLFMLPPLLFLLCVYIYIKQFWRTFCMCVCVCSS